MSSDARSRTRRAWVLLDTNAWFLPERAGTDLAGEIGRLVPNYRLGVSRSVLRELERLVARGTPGAGLALALARTAEVVETGSLGDAGVLEAAVRRQAWVVTADRRLAARLLASGVSVLAPRDRVRLAARLARSPAPARSAARPRGRVG